MASNKELQDRVAELEAENAELRRNQAAQPNTRPVAHKPSFGLSAGTVADLQAARDRVQAGELEAKDVRVVDPFDSAKVYGLDALEAWESGNREAAAGKAVDHAEAERAAGAGATPDPAE